jgi:hypothetical protein
MSNEKSNKPKQQQNVASASAVVELKNAITLIPKVKPVTAIEVSYENMNDIIKLFQKTPTMTSSTTFSCNRQKFAIGDFILFDKKEGSFIEVLSKTAIEHKYDVQG